MKVQISEDLLMNMTNSIDVNGNFEEDLVHLQDVFDPTEPCYILARTDKKK